jgi:hypothetical protein
VAQTAQGVTQGAAGTYRAAEDLSRLSTDLLDLVSRFQSVSRKPGPTMSSSAPNDRDRPALPPTHTNGDKVLAGSGQGR